MTNIHLTAFYSCGLLTLGQPVRIIPGHWFNGWSLGFTFYHRAEELETALFPRPEHSLSPSLWLLWFPSEAGGNETPAGQAILPTRVPCEALWVAGWESPPQIFGEGLSTSLLLLLSLSRITVQLSPEKPSSQLCFNFEYKFTYLWHRWGASWII